MINQGKLANLDARVWGGRMEGVPCFILGNAPSINNVNLSLLDNYFTVGINRIFYSYDPTVLMWQDLALWVQERNKILECKAIKYCRMGSETRGGFYSFKLGAREPRLTTDVSVLNGRGSSGTIAYQFVRALGCDPIILVGMDCSYAKINGNEITDFYGKNPMHKPYTIPNCEKGLRFIRDNCKGKTLYNCSDNKIFPEKMTIEEVITKLPDKKYSREELENMLLKGLKSD